MADKPRRIPFHENGKLYIWDKASGIVTNARDEVVARECFNLQTARARV